MLTDDQKQMIQNLKRLSQNAKKTPWQTSLQAG